MKILLIEDESGLAADIRAYLEPEQIITTIAPSIEDAQEAIHLYEYDVVLLDVGLPDGNGLDLIESILKREPAPGILIVSAKDSLDDKLSGMDLGADDYITKPFHLAELLSRIRAVYRRKKFGGKKAIRFGELEIYPDAYEMRIKGERVQLSPKEFQLLLYFAGNPNKVLTKAVIAEHLWGDQADTLDDFDFIYSHVKNLRRKIVQKGGEDRIRSVYGIGYKFMAE